MGFSIVPTLSKGIGYETMLDCISRGFQYGNYVSYAKAVPTFVIGEEAYYLASELFNAEIKFYERERAWRIWYEKVD